jgi:hypothetical protein
MRKIAKNTQKMHKFCEFYPKAKVPFNRLQNPSKTQLTFKLGQNDPFISQFMPFYTVLKEFAL